SVDDPRGDRRERGGAGHRRIALRALRVARRDQVLREGVGGASQSVRRPCVEGGRRGEGRARSTLMTATGAEQQQNPLEEGLRLRRAPDPCALVIFGASGDLTHKKLMPALYALMVRR